MTKDGYKMDKNEWINDFQDSMRAEHSSNPLVNYVVTKEAGFGAKLSASVSPCVWMYSAPFQISVKMLNGGDTIVVDKELQLANASKEDVARLLDTVQIRKCKSRGCANPAFDPTSAYKHRDGKCEACFMAALNAKFAKDQERQQSKLSKLDAKNKEKGYTHRVDTWVHTAGGDKLMSIWMVNANDATVAAELKRHGIVVLNDYSVHVL